MDDPLEKALEACLRRNNIEFTRPEREKEQPATVDFYLPRYNLYVEVKAHSCHRVHDQLDKSGLISGPVMILIGLSAVQSFAELLGETLDIK